MDGAPVRLFAVLSGYEVLVVALAVVFLFAASIAALVGVVLRLVRGRVEARRLDAGARRRLRRRG